MSGLSLTLDSRRVAVALGDGTIQEFDLGDGHLLQQWHWQDAVAKDVSYNMDGSLLATAITTKGEQHVFRRPDGTPLDILPTIGLRRVAWMASGWLISCTYLPNVWGWKPGWPTSKPIFSVQLGELERNFEGTLAVSIDVDDWLWRVTDGDPPTFQRYGHFPVATAAAPIGKEMIVLVGDELIRLDENGQERWHFPMGTMSMDVAVSPDAHLFATAMLDGDVLVWRADEKRPIARLVGHTARVGELAFSADGHWLVTGGWDDSVRVWNTDVLEAPAEELRSSLEREWGRDLSAILQEQDG